MSSTPDNPSPQKQDSPANPADAGVSSVVRRWQRDDLLRKWSVALRAVALVFSLLSLVIMASNKHGDWKDFDKYEEYRYVLAIAILSTVYTGWQSILKARLFTTAKQLPAASSNSALIDFFGDQIVAYLLLSSASSAVPMTNRMREGSDNIFTDSSAASISMSFLAFFSLGLSALVSGYKLSTQSHI